MSNPVNYGRLWGQIPNTAGQVFWVAPAASYTVNGQAFQASDDLDGLDPTRALVTVARAWALVTADAGDVIVLLPGTHSPAASIAANVAGVTMMGLPSGAGHFQRQKTRLASVTGDQTINVTAADIEIAYLDWTPITADSAIDASAAADRLHIHHCSFQLTDTANTGTIGIDFIGAAEMPLIQDCYFLSDGAQGPAIAWGATTDGVGRNLTLMVSAGTWLSAMTQAAAGRRLYMKNIAWLAGNGVITNGILGTASGEVSMLQLYESYCADSMTNVIDGYDAGDAELVEVYEAGIGNTDGGVLIVVTT